MGWVGPNHCLETRVLYSICCAPCDFHKDCVLYLSSTWFTAPPSSRVSDITCVSMYSTNVPLRYSIMCLDQSVGLSSTIVDLFLWLITDRINSYDFWRTDLISDDLVNCISTLKWQLLLSLLQLFVLFLSWMGRNVGTWLFSKSSYYAIDFISDLKLTGFKMSILLSYVTLSSTLM